MSLAHLHTPLKPLLERALAPDGLMPVFQPLVELDGLTVIAHEGLVRPHPATEPLTILDLLEVARTLGRQRQLELHAARLICEAFVAQAPQGRLLINFSAPTLLHGKRGAQELVSWLAATGIELGRITVELTERDLVCDCAELLQAGNYLRQQGLHLALDDFGNGHANFHVWNELRPEVVKIDRYLVHRLATDPNRRCMVRALAQVAETLGCRLVGEGIEDLRDLAVLRELGIPYAQGFLLGRPASHTVTQISTPAQALGQSDGAPRPLPLPHQETARPVPVGPLAIPAPTVSPAQTNEDVIALFTRHPALHAVAVLAEQRPVGLINRQLLIERMAQPFTRELYGRKSCTVFMNDQPLVCEEQQSIDSLLDVLRGEDQRYLTDGFVITRDGCYVGLGAGEALVRRVTDHRIETARHANPLTSLPGNIPTTGHLDRLLQGSHPFAAAYVDINDFKPFNDHYGYFRGDEMIRLLANVLRAEVDGRQDFVGHIGGDDFLVLFQNPNWHDACERIVLAFNARASALFDPPDLARGGLQGRDRRGQAQFFPLSTVKIGVVQIHPPHPVPADAVAALAARAKSHAKLLSGGIHVMAAGEGCLGETSSL